MTWQDIPSPWWEVLFGIVGMAALGVIQTRFATRKETDQQHAENSIRLDRIEERQRLMPALSDLQQMDARVRNLESSVSGMSAMVSGAREDLRDLKEMVRRLNDHRGVGD